MMDDPFGAVTLKYWYGGSFKTSRNGTLVYEGGIGRTFSIDPDQLCWWWLEDFAKHCGVENVEALLYLEPGEPLESGLRKVYSYNEVNGMREMLLKFRCVEIYVHKGVELPKLHPMPTQVQKKKAEPLTHDIAKHKLPIKRAPRLPLMIKDAPSQKDAPTSIVLCPFTNIDTTTQPISFFPKNKGKAKQNTQPLGSFYQPSPLLIDNSPFPDLTSNNSLLNDDDVWVDNRPKSPLDWGEILGFNDDLSGDEKDPLYDPAIDKRKNVMSLSKDEGNESDGSFDLDDDEEQNGELLTGIIDGYDSEVDEEDLTARERVRTCTAKLQQIANQLQKEVAEGKLGCEANREGWKEPEVVAEGSIPPCEGERHWPRSHHEAIAQPSQLGRGGRMIRGGRGSRGGRTGSAFGGESSSASTTGQGRGSRGGRGSKGGRGLRGGRGSRGLGVLFGADGSVLNQGPSQSNVHQGPSQVTQVDLPTQTSHI
uniref:PB1-like domain-containing protein n=1 Tax=Chenopodium quinoa TaxID=63459 RepID=A0A803N506_CHEQI